MDSTAHATVEEVVPPDEAFALLGNDIRMDILRALFAASAEVVPFSEVRERVGIRDGGHVNYHLSELCPHFVASTDGGYVLQRPGYAVLRLCHQGRLTEAADLTPGPLPEPCVRCGGQLLLGYRDQFAVVACRRCQHWFVRYLFPPGALAGRTHEEIAHVLDQRCRTIRRMGMAGVCPACNDEMTRRLADDDQFGHDVCLAFACEQCGCAFDSTVGAALVGHPEVVAFQHDHGLDTRAPNLWELPFAYLAERVVREESGSGESDPQEASLTLRGDEETLRLYLDADARVTDVRRWP